MSGLALEGADWRASGALLPATAKDGPSDASSVRVDGPGTHKLTYPSPRPRRTAPRGTPTRGRACPLGGRRPARRSPPPTRRRDSEPRHGSLPAFLRPGPLRPCLLCNALTDADVRRAVLAGGARRPAEVFAACGCRAQCGSCVRALCDLSRREAVIAPLVLAASAAGAVPAVPPDGCWTAPRSWEEAGAKG